MTAHANTEPMNAPLRKAWTQEEFFSWAERQEPRYEFDGFQPVAMTGGTINHDRITRKLNRSLDTRLGTGPCEPLGPNAGVETAGKAVRYPDALVTCSKVEGEKDTSSRVSSSFSRSSAPRQAASTASSNSVNTPRSRLFAATSSSNPRQSA